MMIPITPIVLKGKDARAFERYMKKPATKKEIDYFKNAEKFYLKHCQQKQSNVTSKTKK